MPRDSSPDLAQANILPLHAVPSDGSVRVIRRGGRPKKVELRPTISEIDHGAAVDLQRQQALADDPILTAKTSLETMARTILELAREQASLGFERRQGELRGKDISQIASRRVDALAKLARLLVEAHDAGLYGNDPSPKKLELVREHWLTAISGVVAETLGAERAKPFIERYSAEIRALDIAEAFRSPQ